MDKKDLLNITAKFETTDRMPILFVGHGSPTNAIEDNEFTQGWQKMAQSIPLPNAVLCISAHWETNGTYVTSMKNPQTIHDFGGFPEELYKVQYPAPGSPELAVIVSETITRSSIRQDENWGLDHGCWSVLKHFYPMADVPIVQMSLDYTLSPQSHYDLAKELGALRRKGVLVIGSGNMVHNLRMVAWDHLNESGYIYDWAEEANEKFKNNLLERNHSRLIDYSSQGKAVHLAVPTPEHYLPMLYIAALQEEGETINYFNDNGVGGSLTMTSFKIDTAV